MSVFALYLEIFTDTAILYSGTQIYIFYQQPGLMNSHKLSFYSITINRKSILI